MRDKVAESFKVLNVSPSSSRKEVRQAYRELVKTWHPDRFQNEDAEAQARANKKIKQINTAYEEAVAYLSREDNKSRQDERRQAKKRETEKRKKREAEKRKKREATSKDPTVLTTVSPESKIVNPTDNEIRNAVRKVYEEKIDAVHLILSEEENLFIQLPYGGRHLEHCAGPKGPIYATEDVSLRKAMQMFSSYAKGNANWKGDTSWKTQVEEL